MNYINNNMKTHILPYVYLLTHKTTNEFYIGFRCSNKVPSSEDLGFKYFTSSKTVKSKFNEFDVQIIAEFFDKDSAYQFEQSLIQENFSNPLILNKHWQSTTKYSMLGFARPDLAEYNKKTKSKPKETREYECTFCRDTFYKLEFIHHHRQLLPFCSLSCCARFNGKYGKKTTKGTTFKRDKPNWNKGLSGSTCFSTNNPMKNPESVKKMLETRAKNKLKIVPVLDDKEPANPD